MTTIGAGTLTLDTDQYIPGGTTVRNSTLIVGRNTSEAGVRLTGDILLEDAGVLGGAGRIFGSVTSEGGTITPGNSIGTTTIFGDYSGTNATLQIEVEGHANASLARADQLVVAGDIDVSGTTLALVMTPLDPTQWAMVPTGPFTIVDNWGTSAIAGSFESIDNTNHLYFLEPHLSYTGGDGNDISLTLTRNDLAFEIDGSTVNQRAVGASLDSMDWSNPVYNAMAMSISSEAEALASYESLSGEINASARSQLIEDSHFIRTAISNRLYQRAADDLLYPGAGPNGAERGGPALWSRAFGSWGRVDGDGNAAGLDRSIGGVFLGADVRVLENTRIGLVGGYSASNMDGDAHHASMYSDNYNLGAYIGTGFEVVKLRAGIAAAWHRMDGERFVSLGSGTFIDNLDSSQDVTTFQAFGEAGIDLNVSSIPLEPFAGFAWVNLASDGFTERGGHAVLTSQDQSDDMLFTTLGLRAASGFMVGETGVTLQGKIGWQHTSDDTTALTQAFAAGGDRFTIEGVPIAQDQVFLEAGLAASLSERSSMVLNYSSQISSDAQNHGVNARFNLRF
ncbi:autotransporter domain-containing protein [Microbulbifer sp. VAAF005]|uniref:autotransporter family protein n=1 Tax=Microbulbifer sp. VAAF005 TaxID=3034230 RepID=UPI0024AD3DBD|nr:autotransporter domain-containing protein [Microbulbifer sp. VAAF005]WHI45751.1 autotransporter domain-containing protein [Microbulbifer sp. VAAF005]